MCLILRFILNLLFVVVKCEKDSSGDVIDFVLEVEQRFLRYNKLTILHKSFDLRIACLEKFHANFIFEWAKIADFQRKRNKKFITEKFLTQIKTITKILQIEGKNK